MLPSDFDIFSASVSIIPLCIQIWAKPRPAPSDWAISFSWWGKTRSEPPPWIANSGPSSASAIAEHSMCQPGRPGPQGESQEVSSSGLWAFQRAKSSGSSLSEADPASSPWSMSSVRRLESLPYSAIAADLEVDVAARLVGVAGVDQLGDQLQDLADRLGRQRLGVGAAEPEPSVSSK